MAKRKNPDRYLLCVKNDKYPASLEVRKVYRVVPDDVAAARKFVRIVDESGEDYLYPESYFVAIELSKAAASAFSKAS
ncbi:MAG: hypothetical protein HYR84_02140 [Planctomycetes bacterium]|nr:hypothetical protein [Planctomycetota bacterium]